MKSTSLKKFLSFLKIQKTPPPVRFSFVDEAGSLLPALSLRENISLDSIPSVVSQSREFTLEDHLERTDNKALVRLYKEIELFEDLPYQVDSQTRKTAALVKGLLQKSDYLFLECPEKFMNNDRLQLFTEALLHHLSDHGQTLFLMTNSPSYWLPYISKTVNEVTCPETGVTTLKLENHILDGFKDRLLKDTAHSGVLVFNHPVNGTKEVKKPEERSSATGTNKESEQENDSKDAA